RAWRFARCTLPKRGLEVQNPDIRQVAVFLLVVQAVADYENIRNLEPQVGHRHFHPAGVRLAEQGTDPQALRTANLQLLQQIRERQAGIDDVFHNQDVAPRDVLAQVAHDSDG